MQSISTATEQGLTQEQALQRLTLDGANDLKPPVRRTLVQIVRPIVLEPMFLLLMAAGTLYMLLGDIEDAAMLLAFVIMTALITTLQEARTERSLQALRDLSSPRAMVVRDGVTQRIAGRDVVYGDVLVLTDGDRVAADAELIQAHDLQVDESLLSGESMPVAKSIAMPSNDDSSPCDGSKCVYAGTLVVSGQGLAKVNATGTKTRMGRIGETLHNIVMPPTPLQMQTRRLVQIFSLLGMVLSAVVVVLYGWMRSEWYAGLLAGITLAMSMLPEEFILITTVFMAMGAWRLSVQRVLVRRNATIETLGTATVLCTDKTGTLTSNHMEVAEMACLQADHLDFWSAEQSLGSAFEPLLEYAILASEQAPFDPMDKALIALAKLQQKTGVLHPDWRLVHEYGLSPQCMAMTHVWQAPYKKHNIVAVKGGVEVVLELCKIDSKNKQWFEEASKQMASRGLRVLAVAQAKSNLTQWPDSAHGFEWSFLGLVGLADPLRAGVPEAVEACHHAGIRVVMLTGDHPATAAAIAEQAGLQNHHEVVTGEALSQMGQAERYKCIGLGNVFARVQPEHKLEILQTLRAGGAVVAMTGDGVNDAPALKAAHIGIAMGGRGTDVAREAAALVLLDDDFGSIVRAIALGRNLEDNLRKAFAFALAVHVPIAGLTILPLLCNTPPMLAPVHVAFLELIIAPVCSLVFEAKAPENNVMERPPRPKTQLLLPNTLIMKSLMEGVLILLVVFGIFSTQIDSGVATDIARTLGFIVLVLCNLALILHHLRRPNRWFWRILGLVVLMMTAILLIPALRQLFHFGALAQGQWLIAVAIAVGLLAGLRLNR